MGRSVKKGVHRRPSEKKIDALNTASEKRWSDLVAALHDLPEFVGTDRRA
jgi:hypothetical protein